MIDIPDAFYEIYNSIDLSDKNWDEKYYVYGIAYSLLVGLQDGQPLPKGHGDLIDRKEFTKYSPIWMEDKRRTGDDIPVILLDDILKVDAIIKADGGNEE